MSALIEALAPGAPRRLLDGMYPGGTGTYLGANSSDRAANERVAAIRQADAV